MSYAATGCKRERYLQKFGVESCFGLPFGMWQGTKSLFSPHWMDIEVDLQFLLLQIP